MHIENIIKYESGKMDTSQEIAFFQSLINTGMIWKLSSHYKVYAIKLLQAGICFPASVIRKHEKEVIQL